MADLIFVCVRENVPRAEALAQLFEAAGFTIGDACDGLRGAGAGVIVWSEACSRSRPFLDSARRVIASGKALIVCLDDTAPPVSFTRAPLFDISGWKGDPDDVLLDPVFSTADRLVTAPALHLVHDRGQTVAASAGEQQSSARSARADGEVLTQTEPWSMGRGDGHYAACLAAPAELFARSFNDPIFSDLRAPSMAWTPAAAHRQPAPKSDPQPVEPVAPPRPRQRGRRNDTALRVYAVLAVFCAIALTAGLPTRTQGPGLGAATEMLTAPSNLIATPPGADASLMETPTVQMRGLAPESAPAIVAAHVIAT